MKEITQQLDLKAEKLNTISVLLKTVDVDNSEELTHYMLRKLKDRIELLLETDF